MCLIHSSPQWIFIEKLFGERCQSIFQPGPAIQSESGISFSWRQLCSWSISFISVSITWQSYLSRSGLEKSRPSVHLMSLNYSTRDNLRSHGLPEAKCFQITYEQHNFIYTWICTSLAKVQNAAISTLQACAHVVRTPMKGHIPEPGPCVLGTLMSCRHSATKNTQIFPFFMLNTEYR